LREKKSIYCQLTTDTGEIVYMRVFRFAYYDPKKPERCKSLTIGMEMEAPSGTEALPHNQRLVELTAFKTISPNVFTVKRGLETFLLLRAARPTDGKPTEARPLKSG